MNNIWTDRKATNRYYSMPVAFSSDRELEYEQVKGSRILKLIEYWTRAVIRGSITVPEHRAITAIILCQFETEYEG